MTMSGTLPEDIIRLNFSSVPVEGETVKSKFVLVISLSCWSTRTSLFMGMLEVLGQKTVTSV